MVVPRNNAGATPGAGKSQVTAHPPLQHHSKCPHAVGRKGDAHARSTTVVTCICTCPSGYGHVFETRCDFTRASSGPAFDAKCSDKHRGGTQKCIPGQVCPLSGFSSSLACADCMETEGGQCFPSQPDGKATRQRARRILALGQTRGVFPT